jgi:AcrR family transcriptional regulator
MTPFRVGYNRDMSPSAKSGSVVSVRKSAAKTKGATRRKERPLGREIWLDTARQALIEEGTAGVEINKLAKRLGSSRGGFYWFFKDRAQLLDELLDYWARTSSVLFERVLQNPSRNGVEEYLALTNLWIDEKEYDPRWDGAVRDWARTSDAVRRVVQDVDQKRIAVLERIFNDMGYTGKEAHIRARVTYYHQVGYYALGVQESQKERRALLPYYQRVLTGREL